VYHRGVTVSRRKLAAPDRLLTDAEVADRLGVKPRTVREMRFDGRLEYVRLGYRSVRTEPAAVERLISASRRRGGGA
jgi:excisionase family DNA binding protein